MASKRVDDTDSGRSWFRSDRLVRESDKWFFLTREGTVEGPFDTKFEASERLDVYTRVMSTQLIEDAAGCKLA
jgi:hypothetical protein